jgi:peptidoglycan/LPS O-acetylase OafA/YrhL
MKKSVIVFFLAVLILTISGFWFFSSGKLSKSIDLLTIGILILVVVFALIWGRRRLNSARRGEAGEDELSKKVMQKTSSVSFYISLYLWLAIMYFSDRINYEIHTIIGAGILCMAVIFGICWLIFNFSGIRNE